MNQIQTNNARERKRGGGGENSQCRSKAGEEMGWLNLAYKDLVRSILGSETKSLTPEVGVSKLAYVLVSSR